MIARLRRALAALSPRRVLAIGWVGVVLYAFPGYMSYDSVVQLGQARTGEFGGGHPPLMSLLWAAADAIIAGPLLMLLLQVTCFVIGTYLLLGRDLGARAAAWCTLGLAWFPPIAAVMAVIWKDAQMAGFLVLGAAFLGSPRRAVRLGGLALIFAATGMRYNALAITLPIVVLLFGSGTGWRRYAIAIAAWLGVTAAASGVNRTLIVDASHTHLWHESLALLDLTGTLRYAPDLAADELSRDLTGTPLLVPDPQRVARTNAPASDLPEDKLHTFGDGGYTPALWVTTFHVFAPPVTPAERAAVARAWRRIVLAHPRAYLAYRWRISRERIGLGDPIGDAAYVWFTDVLHVEMSELATGHAAVPSRFQRALEHAMRWLGDTWLFRPWPYLALAVVLVPFCLRDRTALALVASGLANEAALFFIAPTIDYRYSVWLVIGSMLAAIRLIALRFRRARG